MPIVVSGSAGSSSTITSYGTLQSAITSWLHRAGDTVVEAVVPDLITLGENRIYRELRVRQMETALSSAIASGVIAVPSGYVEMKFAYVNSSPTQKLKRKDAEWIYHNYPTRSSDSKPMFFAREGANFIFGPYPDSNYTIKGVYYKQLDHLNSSTNTSNWLITDVPDLILFASLCEAAPWIQDDARVTLWEQKYKQVKDSVQTQDLDEEFSGSPLQATVR